MTGAGIVYAILLVVLAYGLYRSKDLWFSSADFHQGARFMAGLAFILILIIGAAVLMLRA